ncbi:MAG: Rid family detoxifying hydrolase [Oscillospiraceae bacterium]|nr:Rid family detoxifying hydrolase [Oscillospiraceae bacterium]
MNKKEVINESTVVPYSQAVVANGFMYVSGQIPMNLETGEVVIGTIEEQTRLVLDNIKIALKTKALGLDSVIKTMIFVTDLNDYATVNAVYAEYFSKGYPARSCVEVSALPRGVNVEIECIAICN